MSRMQIDRRARRGMALLMVMIVLAATATTAYVALSTATLQVQGNAYIRAEAEARLAAENGVTLAKHLLLHPEDVHEPMPEGHFAGTGGRWLAAGTQVELKVDVTRVDTDRYRIIGQGRTRDGEGNPVVRGVEVVVRGLGEWQPMAAVNLQRDLELHVDKVTVQGGLATAGNIRIKTDEEDEEDEGDDEDDPDRLPDALYAANSNLPNYRGRAPSGYMPPLSDLLLVRAAHGDRRYVQDGVEHVMIRWTSDKIDHWSPAYDNHVYLWDEHTPLKFRAPGAVVNATFVVTRGKVKIEAPAAFRGKPGQPTIVALDGLEIKSGNPVRFEGLTVAGDKIKGGDAVFAGATLVYDNDDDALEGRPTFRHEPVDDVQLVDGGGRYHTLITETRIEK